MGCGASREFTGYNSLGDELGGGDNFSGPYVNPNEGHYNNFLKKTPNACIIQDLQKSFKTFANNKCLGYRKPIKGGDKEFEPDYTYFTYEQIWQMAETLSKVFNKLELVKEVEFEEEKGKFKFMGIFSKNCVEWIVTDLACQLDSITSSTFYSTLGEDSFDHIFEQGRISTLTISPDCIPTLVKYYAKNNFPTLKNILVFDHTLSVKEEDLISLKQLKDVKVYSFTSLILTKQEELKDVVLNMSKPDTVLTLSYTSGTTNLPKGVKITQRMFGSQMCTFDDINITISQSDAHLSFLPLAHIMERSVLLLLMNFGMSFGFLCGDIKKYLLEDMNLVRPTILIAVPRLLSQFRTTILDGMEKLSGITKSLATSALETKRANFAANGQITHWFYDSVVFNKIRNKFGGRIALIITGSAPLPKDVASDIKILMSVPIIEAYGMTETCGAVVGTSFFDTTNDSCGGSVRTNIFKLQAVPEMNYGPNTLDDKGNPSPTGEICVKGVNLTPGYFRDEKNTKSLYDSEGWLHTGDVGRICFNDKGLKIIDRVKEIFKLAQGEYIAPSKLESVYAKSKYVAQICVFGDSLHTFLIGIVFPNKLHVGAFLKEKGLLVEGKKEEDFYTDEVLINEIRKTFDDLGKANNFNSLEKLPKLILSTEEFTPQSGLLTPTMKYVRKKFELHFKEKITAIYSQNK